MSKFQQQSQFTITRPYVLKNEWKVTSLQLPEVFWVEFNTFAATTMTNDRQEKIGRFFSPRLLTFKKRAIIDTKEGRIDATWSPTFRTFRVRGTSTFKGFEAFDWKWRRRGLNTSLTLEDVLTGQCIAEFNRTHFSFKEVGKITIVSNLPKDLSSLIVFTACYSYRKIIQEQRSHGGD